MCVQYVEFAAAGRGTSASCWISFQLLRFACTRLDNARCHGESRDRKLLHYFETRRASISYELVKPKLDEMTDGRGCKPARGESLGLS